MPPRSELKFPEGSMIERITGQPVRVRNRPNKPCGWVLRNPAEWPNPHGPAESVLYDILRQAQIMDAEQMGEPRASALG